MTNRSIEAPKSGTRRRVERVRVSVSVVVACPDGRKVPARAADASSGGMFLECAEPPAYGTNVTIAMRGEASTKWAFLPATVRWVTARGCGLAFGLLGSAERRALAELLESAA